MVEQKHSQDEIFHALSDASRRAMIERLAQSDHTVGELAEPLDMTFAGVSKHIGVLEGAGLVTRRKRGRERVCSLQLNGLLAVRDWVEKYSAFWNARLDALDAALKEDSDD